MTVSVKVALMDEIILVEKLDFYMVDLLVATRDAPKVWMADYSVAQKGLSTEFGWANGSVDKMVFEKVISSVEL